MKLKTILPIFILITLFSIIASFLTVLAPLLLGKIIDILDMDELRKMNKKNYILTVNSKKEAERLKQEKNLNIQKIEDNKISILVEKDLPKVLKILSNYEILDLQKQSQSLEELFLHFYGKEDNEND